jgi:hypothetical protein
MAGILDVGWDALCGELNKDKPPHIRGADVTSRERDSRFFLYIQIFHDMELLLIY